MTADPRLFIRLSELRGIDALGLSAYQPADDRWAHNTSIGVVIGPPLTDPAFHGDRTGRLTARSHPDDDEAALAEWWWDDRMSVSLADAVTRDRCLRWLAEREGLVVGCGAPMWESHVDHGWGVKSTDGWHLSTSLWDDGAGYDAPAWLASALQVDPRDDTRLPDGSRLVDALALAAVLRQVGGAA
jgi:hypothetical protein